MNENDIESSHLFQVIMAAEQIQCSQTDSTNNLQADGSMYCTTVNDLAFL